jgi:hypothetical protein
MLRSCSAHEYGGAIARPVTVRSVGTVPSAIAAMMRGETKASGASRRMCRSPRASRLAISAQEAIRPSQPSSIHPRALAIAMSRAWLLWGRYLAASRQQSVQVRVSSRLCGRERNLQGRQGASLPNCWLVHLNISGQAHPAVWRRYRMPGERASDVLILPLVTP